MDRDETGHGPQHTIIHYNNLVCSESCSESYWAAQFVCLFSYFFVIVLLLLDVNIIIIFLKTVYECFSVGSTNRFFCLRLFLCFFR